MARWWVGGTGSWITGDTSHWAASSGGASGATVPTTADDVTFDSLSGLVNGTVITVDGTATANNVTITGAAVKMIDFAFSANVTFAGNLTVGGNTVRGVNRLFWRSSTVGNRRTVTVTGGTVTITGDIDFLDIAFASVTTWTNSGPSYIGDGGNNGTTVTTNRTTPAAQTWSGTSGGSWGANAWSGRAPLPQDACTISAAFIASQTISQDMPRMGAGLDFTGVTGTPIFTNGSFNCWLFGSLILAAGLGTYTSVGTSMTLTGRGSHVITSNGHDTGNPLTINCGTGTYTLTDNLVSGVSGGLGRGFNHLGGTVDYNGKNLYCGNFTSSGTISRTMLNLTGTFTLVQTGGTAFNIGGSGFTADFSLLSLVVGFSSGTGATATISPPPSAAFASLACTDATNNHLNVLLGNRFGALNVQCSAARTLTLPAGLVQQVGLLTLQGGASALSVVSATPGTKTQIAFVRPGPNRTGFANVTLSGDIVMAGRRPAPVLA